MSKKSEASRGNSRTHFQFAMLLVAFALFKYNLYGGATPKRPLGAGALGASLSQFLLWALCYAICLGSKRPTMMAAIAWFAFMVAVWSLPIVGWMGLAILIALRIEESRLSSIRADTLDDVLS